MQSVVMEEGQLFEHNGSLAKDLVYRRLIYLQNVLSCLPSMKSETCCYDRPVRRGY